MSTHTTNTISPAKLAELMAKVREKKVEPPATPEVQQDYASIVSEGRHGEAITLNAEQAQMVSTALTGKSTVLIGAAGTGKTTCMKATVSALSQSGRIPIFQNVSHKYLPASGVPGIVAVAFTRRAVANLRKAMPTNMHSNCITIHKLLEYEPVYSSVFDPETGFEKSTMSFKPSRDSYNPLPTEIQVCIIDESSMVSVEFFNKLQDAFPHPVQFIFLGDIQQLPPVFGSAILGYKMLELPCIELTQVYRQALDSPIIKLATDIKEGKTFTLKDNVIIETPQGKVTLHPWKKKIDFEKAMFRFCMFITQALDQGGYSPDTDCILIPFNKAFGTDDVNKHLANHIAKKEGRDVYEVIAGFNKLYFSAGDHVLYDKEDATIIEIKRNSAYLGKKPALHSKTLDYFGYDSGINTNSTDSTNEEIYDIDAMLSSLAEIEDNDERVRSASHIITIQMDDSGRTIEVSSASELNTLLLSYALTVHKSQGSEWDKVFLILHQSHATMIQRELLYTAVTRAAKELYVICEPDTFEKGVKSQKIKGNTLAEKAEFFKGKLESKGFMK